MLNKVSEGFPEFRPFLSNHVAANTPEVPSQTAYSSVLSLTGTGFAHKIGARPPLFMLFTKLPLRSFSLQPGRLRCALSGYVVESLSI